jgi:sialidase-1
VAMGLADLPQTFEDILVVPMVPNRTHRGSSGSIVALRDGTLLFAHANPQHWVDTKYSGVLAHTSADQGRTWSPAFELQKNVARYATLGPSLLRLANGELLFGYNVLNRFQGPDTRFYDGKFYVRRSSDDGKTWTDPACATPCNSYHTTNPDAVIQLSTGRIVVPAEWSKAVGGGEAGHMVSLCYYSDDGFTWVRSKNYVDMGSTTEEPSIVELRDGRLLMIFRNRSGFVGRAWSEDGGDTWIRAGYYDQLASPLAPQMIKRIPKTGDLLLIWEHNKDAPAAARKEPQPMVQIGEVQRVTGAVRSPLTAAISRDDGQTWTHIRDIATGPQADYGYTGIAFVGDLALVNFHSLKGIHVARIGLGWFYSG